MTTAILEVNALLCLSHRDIVRFLREPIRLITTLIVPLFFIGILGTTFQVGLGERIGYNFVTFTFTGIFAQVLFQSTALGITSLVEDREHDLTQEMFIAPISRYTILLGKLLGESLVACLQGGVILVLGLLIGVPFTLHQVIALLPVALVACLFGGAFGLIVVAGFGNQRTANQVMPFLIFPQYFLAGVVNPLQHLPWYLTLLSLVTPMRYPVDLARGIYYVGRPEYGQVVLLEPVINLIIMALLFVVLLFLGTLVFVRSERNR